MIPPLLALAISVIRRGHYQIELFLAIRESGSGSVRADSLRRSNPMVYITV